MTLSERLKKMRERLGKTQKGMANTLGIAPRTWQNYEEGVHEPSWKVLEGLAGLGVNVNGLFTGDEEMKKREGVNNNARKTTATGRMAKSIEDQYEKYVAPLIEVQNERDLEVGVLVRLINELDYDNVFKLADIVEDMLNLQEEQEEQADVSKTAINDITESKNIQSALQ
jgi:transcriptional regulator with XRE-family HTH domain